MHQSPWQVSGVLMQCRGMLMLLGQGGLSAGCHPGPGQVSQPSVNEDFAIMEKAPPG